MSEQQGWEPLGVLQNSELRTSTHPLWPSDFPAPHGCVEENWLAKPLNLTWWPRFYLGCWWLLLMLFRWKKFKDNLNLNRPRWGSFGMSKLVFLHRELEKAACNTQQPKTMKLFGAISEAPNFWGGRGAHRHTLSFFWFICFCGFSCFCIKPAYSNWKINN